MDRSFDTPLLGRSEPHRGVGRTLSWLRWMVVAVVLVITLILPTLGRTGHPLWPFVAGFSAYNLLVELLRARTARLRSFAWVPILDLPVVGALYFFDAEPGGPLFILFHLAVISAAATLSLRGVLLYTAAALTTIMIVAPTLPLWSSTTEEIRALSSRLVVLTLVGVGTALLTRRLAREQARARSMRDEAERLEALDPASAGFISTVSHDLRTPLTAARAGLGMLETSAVDRLGPPERDLLSNVRRNIERLARLINDLLTVNQIEAGALQLEREPLDLRAIVTDAMSGVHPLMREKRQILEVELSEALPTEGDARRLEQVVVNVLANAHQHTPPGTRITISGHPSDGVVILTVSDNGPGIPPEEHEAIFRRFHRLQSNGGSGLGLEIARSIVELHRGRLWVESMPKRGATFHVALPRCAARPEEGS